MGPDFYKKNCKELYGLLHDMEADIGNMLNFLLPDWVPHPAARRLQKTKDRVEQIFMERLRDRETCPEQWTDANDYISYTLGDAATAHLKQFYASHHTLLMFAAHTSTVASISWTIIEVGLQSSKFNRLVLSRGSFSNRPNTLIPFEKIYKPRAILEAHPIFTLIKRRPVAYIPELVCCALHVNQ